MRGAKSTSDQKDQKRAFGKIKKSSVDWQEKSGSLWKADIKQRNHIVLAVKHGVGSVIVLGLISRPERFALTDEKINFFSAKKFLKGP